ncbi:MAG: DUF4845 domain-containing protein [Gammaproteobacteria bacterium]
MNIIKKQDGMTTIGVLVVLLLIGFFVLITLRLLPMYLESFSVSTALESLKSEPEVASKTGPDILQLLQKRLDINDVEHVGRDNIDIRRTDTGVVISVKYEVRKELWGNIDLVGKFDKSITVNH